jgi:hypothetical protein
MATFSDPEYFSVELSFDKFMEHATITTPEELIETLSALHKTNPDTVKSILGFMAESTGNPVFGYGIEEALAGIRGMDTSVMDDLGGLFSYVGYVQKGLELNKIANDPNLSAEEKAYKFTKMGYEEVGSLILKAVPPTAFVVNLPIIGPVAEWALLEGGRLIGDKYGALQDRMIDKYMAQIGAKDWIIDHKQDIKDLFKDPGAYVGENSGLGNVIRKEKAKVAAEKKKKAEAAAVATKKPPFAQQLK